VSTDNPVIMFILLIYSLVLCWGNLHNYITFYHKMLWGTKDIMSPPVQKLGGHVPPASPIQSVPGRPHYFYVYEVRPPISSSYIYEIRSIKE